MAHENRFTLRANSPVKPSTVIRTAVVPTGDFLAAPCLPGQVPFGIAQNWTEGSPGTPFDTGNAASGQVRLMVWAPGGVAVAAVKQQTGAVAYGGVLIGPNAASEITFVSTGWAVGWLLESGLDGVRSRHRVFVHPMPIAVAGVASS